MSDFKSLVWQPHPAAVYLRSLPAGSVDLDPYTDAEQAYAPLANGWTMVVNRNFRGGVPVASGSYQAWMLKPNGEISNLGVLPAAVITNLMQTLV